MFLTQDVETDQACHEAVQQISANFLYSVRRHKNYVLDIRKLHILNYAKIPQQVGEIIGKILGLRCFRGQFYRRHYSLHTRNVRIVGQWNLLFVRLLPHKTWLLWKHMESHMAQKI